VCLFVSRWAIPVPIQYRYESFNRYRYAFCEQTEASCAHTVPIRAYDAVTGTGVSGSTGTDTVKKGLATAVKLVELCEPCDPSCSTVPVLWTLTCPSARPSVMISTGTTVASASIHVSVSFPPTTTIAIEIVLSFNSSFSSSVSPAPPLALLPTFSLCLLLLLLWWWKGCVMVGPVRGIEADTTKIFSHYSRAAKRVWIRLSLFEM